jgi:uncharacterized protein YuzE
MRISYDKSVDSAYIYLKDIEPGEVDKTYPCDPHEVNGMINLDFGKNGILLGIEITGASKKLPREILDTAVDK